jgi:hypothetical protein
MVLIDQLSDNYRTVTRNVLIVGTLIRRLAPRHHVSDRNDGEKESQSVQGGSALEEFLLVDHFGGKGFVCGNQIRNTICFARE